MMGEWLPMGLPAATEPSRCAFTVWARLLSMTRHRVPYRCFPRAGHIVHYHASRRLVTAFPDFHSSMTVPLSSSLYATPAGRTASRHLEQFGVEAIHLVASESYDPSARGALAPGSQRCERVVAHAEGLSIPGLNAGTERVVFLFSGTPVPARGDGFVALTQYWRIEHVARIDGEGEHALYAALCA